MLLTFSSTGEEETSLNEQASEGGLPDADRGADGEALQSESEDDSDDSGDSNDRVGKSEDKAPREGVALSTNPAQHPLHKFSTAVAKQLLLNLAEWIICYQDSFLGGEGW